MHVTFHGVRGSLPTPGPSTVRYGGNSACAEVRPADGTLVVLDGGTGMRELGKQFVRDGFADRIHLLITHPHWDHIVGLPFFAPIYRKETRLVLYAFGPRWLARGDRPVLFDDEHFPVQLAELPIQIEIVQPVRDEACIGSARVRRVRLNHPGGSDGFRIDDQDGASICYLTDNELSPPTAVTTSVAELARFAQGAGLLILDAQYLPSHMPAKKGWGHSLVEEALELCRVDGARTAALFHLDPERDDDELYSIGADALLWASTHVPGMQTVVARDGLSLEIGPD